MWGHSVSRDLLTWDYDGCVLMPDEPFDCHGVYSGSALVHDGRVTMFYTGNVKLPDADGSYDYISTGREANTIAVDTRDGSQFGEKRLLMTNADYPSGLTCHVRDPKVWRADAPCGRYLMVQGARRVVASGDDDLTARKSLPVRAQREAPGRYGGLLVRADAVVFVPATASAFRRRGFDHMELIARHLSGRSDIPLLDALVKHGSSDQRELGRADRLVEALGAYEVVLPVRGKRILLIDDVITTGATMSAASRSPAYGVEAMGRGGSPSRFP